MNDLQTTNQLDNPFSRRMPSHVNAGTVMIEQERAIAEVKGKLSVAKMFPRDEAAAFQQVMNACSRPDFAAVATYSFPRGGKTVTGPSIRMAEVIAAAYGNIEYGMRELSRKEGCSEMEAFAWDLQTNTIVTQKFTVNHIRDKSEGGAKVTSERDIYELTANQGARRQRERIFAIVPPDLVEAALQQCRKTLAGKVDAPIADRVRGMIARFNKLGVTEAMIKQRLGRSLDTMLPDDFADYQGVFNSIKDGNTSAAEWFGAEASASPALSAPAAQPGNDNAEAGTGSGKPVKLKGAAAKAAAETAAATAAASPAAAEGDQKETAAPALATPSAGEPEAPEAPADQQQEASGGLGEVF